MSEEKQPNAKDLARWMAGEVTSPKEIDTILTALDNDPKLRKAFEILDDEDEFPSLPSHDPLAELIRSRTTELRGSVLWGLTLDGDDPGRLLRDGKLTGMVFGSSGQHVESVEGFRFEMQALDSAGKEFQMKFHNLPLGANPLNLTVANIGLDSARNLMKSEQDVHPVWGKLGEDWERRRSEMSRPATPVGGLAKTQHVLSADSATSGSCKSAAEREIRVELGKLLPIVNIACDPDPDRDFQLVVMETEFPSDLPGAKMGPVVRRGLVLKRHPKATRDKDFINEGVPLVDVLPNIPYIDSVRLTVRGAKEEDLRLLSSDDVTNFLGQCEMNPFPLTKTEQGFRLRMLESDRADLANLRMTWMLTVALSHDDN